MTKAEIKRLHEQTLYPVVRIRTDKAGGSGTILYSKPDPEHKDEYETYVLTNHHVIADLIKTEKKWDSLLKRETKKEVLGTPEIEYFDYVKLSIRDSGKTFKGEIKAYDEEHDLALLRVDTPTKAKYVASIYPKAKVDEIKLFTPIVCSGCSLGHEPLVNEGCITSLKEFIDQKLYWMGNASMIFGNSGGAIFIKGTGEFIGVPSRVATLQMGFGADVVTWMGFFAPIQRIYEWIDEQELKFLYDSGITPVECFQKREKKQDQARRLMAVSEEKE